MISGGTETLRNELNVSIGRSGIAPAKSPAVLCMSSSGGISTGTNIRSATTAVPGVEPISPYQSGFKYHLATLPANEKPTPGDKLGKKSGQGPTYISKSRPKRCLVTGGAGFVGSHMCDRLVAEGYEVICLDNLLTGTSENIQHLLEHPQFTFFEQDITDPIPIEDMLAEVRSGSKTDRSVDYVLHLASPASPKDYAKFPIHTLKAGALGTWHALGVAKEMRSDFLISSTSEVYGDPEVDPQPETYCGHVNPIGPRSVYDESKRYAEAMTMSYHREHGMRIHIARIFNTYGERMRVDDGRVLPNFMSQALRGEPLTVYGDGNQTRSLCYVSDLVEGLYRLMISDEIGPVNLGNPDEVTIKQLAQEVIEVTGSRSRIAYEPLPEDDPKRRRPDITKAMTVLGWKPKVSRREGLKRVVPYFKAKSELTSVTRPISR